MANADEQAANKKAAELTKVQERHYDALSRYRAFMGKACAGLLAAQAGLLLYAREKVPCTAFVLLFAGSLAGAFGVVAGFLVGRLAWRYWQRKDHSTSGKDPVPADIVTWETTLKRLVAFETTQFIFALLSFGLAVFGTVFLVSERYPEMPVCGLFLGVSGAALLFFAVYGVVLSKNIGWAQSTQTPPRTE